MSPRRRRCCAAVDGRQRARAASVARRARSVAKRASRTARALPCGPSPCARTRRRIPHSLHLERNDKQAERARGRKRSCMATACAGLFVGEHATVRAREQFAQQLESLARQRAAHECRAGDVAAGRARLFTSPLATGSLATAMTIGTVSMRAAPREWPGCRRRPCTATLRSTKSLASRSRSLSCLSANRYSITMPMPGT